MPLDLGARAKEPEQRGHGGIERAGHLRDQRPHLAALGERVGILPFVRRDVALASRVVDTWSKGPSASAPRSAQPSAVLHASTCCTGSRCAKRKSFWMGFVCTAFLHGARHDTRTTRALDAQECARAGVGAHEAADHVQHAFRRAAPTPKSPIPHHHLWSYGVPAITTCGVVANSPVLLAVIGAFFQSVSCGW